MLIGSSLMPEGGFEPPCPKAYAPQTYVSANSTTPAVVCVKLYYTHIWSIVNLLWGQMLNKHLNSNVFIL